MMMLRLFIVLLRRELFLRARRPVEWALPLFFFPLIVAVFALATGGRGEVLRIAGGGILWTAAAFAALLAQEAVFRADREAGIIEQLLTSPHSLIAVAFGKAAAHWLYTGAPLTLLCPLVALLAQQSALWTLTAAMALGSMVFSLLAVFVSALSGKNGALAAFIALPFCLPVLIFAAAASEAAATGQPLVVHFSLLAAMLTFSLTVLPLATAGALRAGGGDD